MTQKEKKYKKGDLLYFPKETWLMRPSGTCFAIFMTGDNRHIWWFKDRDTHARRGYGEVFFIGMEDDMRKI